MAPSLPSHPVRAELGERDGISTLRFERDLAHPIEAVWDALTHPGQVRQWAPFTPARALTVPGAVTLTMNGLDDTPTSGTVLECIPPRLLVYLWEDDELRWELTATATGTRLTLAHRFADRAGAARNAAGWHLCLSALMGVLEGGEVPPVAGEAARERGFEGLFDAYDRLLRTSA